MTSNLTALPVGWTGASLGEVAAFEMGQAPPGSASNFSGQGTVFVKAGEFGKDYPVVREWTTAPLKYARAGDVLICVVGATAGKLNLGIDCAIGRSVAAIRPNGVVLQKIVYRQLQARVASMRAGSTGSAQGVISKEMLAELPIAIPPQMEQQRIADKLDTVLTRVDACRDRLARVSPLLKRFRQSVLAAATSGRLTEEWRADNPAVVGSAELEVQRREVSRRGSLRVRGGAARVSKELLYELPMSWAWVVNHRLASDDGNAICAGPFGTIFKASDFRSQGVPIIFLRHVGAASYLTHKPGFMDRQVWEKHHKPYSVYGGELLVTKLGDPPGTACIYPRDIGVAMVTPDVMKMSVDDVVAESRYLMYFFNGPASKEIVEAMCFGVTRLRIDLSLFKTFPIPMPPLAEQSEIVRRVETLFAFADRLEARLAQAQTAVDRLTLSLLAKAFRGELVPQDPADEPAAELLKRLAAQRATEPASRRRRRMTA